MIGPKSAFPVFIVKDLDTAKSFYTENLDFDVVFTGDWSTESLESKRGRWLLTVLMDSDAENVARKMCEPLPKNRTAG